MNNAPTYKRGTICKNGKVYGFNPGGQLYRIYAQSNVPFLSIVDVHGSTFLRLRQATEQGYTDCPVRGVCDISYPESALSRARTIGGKIGKRTHL